MKGISSIMLSKETQGACTMKFVRMSRTKSGSRIIQDYGLEVHDGDLRSFFANYLQQ